MLVEDRFEVEPQAPASRPEVHNETRYVDAERHLTGERGSL